MFAFFLLAVIFRVVNQFDDVADAFRVKGKRSVAVRFYRAIFFERGGF